MMHFNYWCALVIVSVSLSIGVVSGRLGTYTMTCVATGGVITGSNSLTGPGLPDSGLSLVAEGSIGYTGENTYSVTSDTLSEDVGSVYTCTARNDVSSPQTTLELAGSYTCYYLTCSSYHSFIHSPEAGDPTLSEPVQTSATSVRVTWSHPTEGAPVTGYIVHYTRDDGVSGSESVGSSTTGTEITGLTVDRTYTISVEATANGLSGESAEMTITLSE